MKDMLDWAKFYTSKGFSVIPIKPQTKKPSIRWKKYQQSKPSPEELEQWFKGKNPEDVGIGMILASSNVVVLDIERFEFYDLFFDKPIEEIAKLTWVCRTGKGFHIYFRYDDKVSKIKAEGIAEIRAGSMITVLPPSLHPNGRQYEWLSDVESLQIAPLNLADYTRLINKIKLIRKHFNWVVELAPYWIEGCRHNLALHLAGYLRKQNLVHSECKTLVKLLCILSKDEELKDRLRAVDDTYKKDLTEVSGFKYLKQVLYTVAGESKAREILDKLEMALGKRKSEKRREEESEELSDEEIIRKIVEYEQSILVHPAQDLINNDELAYTYIHPTQDLTLLITEKKLYPARKEGGQQIIKFAENKIIIKPEFWKINEKHFLRLQRLVVRLHREGYINKGASREVLQKLLEKVKYYVWFKNDINYIVIASWIIGTYLFVVFQFYPILELKGPRESGKSTLLSLLSKICFNATPPDVRFTEADFKRTAHHAKPTFVLDEQQYLADSKRYGEIKAILESATEKGRVTSIFDADGGRREEFEIYTPVAIATRREIGIEDKCIVIKMEEPPLEERDEYEYRRSFLETDEEFNEIGVGLFVFALTHHKDIKQVYDELRPTSKLRGRSFQYWRPILAIAKVAYPERFEEVLRYAETITEALREEIRSYEIETVVLRTILTDGITTTTLSDLLKRVQEERPDINAWQKIRSALDNLGIVKWKDTGKRPTIYHIDLKRAKERAIKRGIDVKALEESKAEEESEEEKTSEIEEIEGEEWDLSSLLK